jgi:hypothetical protein
VYIVAGHDIADSSRSVEDEAELAESTSSACGVACAAVGCDCGAGHASAARKIETSNTSGTSGEGGTLSTRRDTSGCNLGEVVVEARVKGGTGCR